MSISIKEVKCRKELKSFIKFPDMLYKNDPLYVPSLYSDELHTLDSRINPAYDFCEAMLYLAMDGKKVVGRIAGIINHHANCDWDEKNVRFGWMEFIDDRQVSEMLINKVAEWGKSHGMKYIKGPLGFTDMDKEGLLVEGYDHLPSITCIYNFPYYKDHLEALGFVKDVDWTQTLVDLPTEVPSVFKRSVSIIEERYNIHVFNPKTKKQLFEKGRQMFYIINESFSDNKLYEFTKLTDSQIDGYVKEYMPLVNKKLVCFVVDEFNDLIGFGLAIPQLSKAMQKARGRIFPFGFIPLMRALKKNDTIEALMIGVIPKFQQKGVHAIIFDYIHTNSLKMGVKKMITNPQLENNHKVQPIFDAYNPQTYIRRRSYKKNID